jgi:antitoxin HicB
MALYRITLTLECPAIPEVVTFGDDEAAAVHWGALAIEEAIAGRIHDGTDVPEADGGSGDRFVARTPVLTDLKVDLYRALRAAGLTRAELGRRLGWKRNSVDRLFDIGHASRLEQLEAAMRALGLRIDARVVALGNIA